MQPALIVVLAFSTAAAVLAASPASFLESSAENQARRFLGSHADKPVQQDELAELKRENPDAYALVNALLTKRSLGLLDPKKPTASFAPVTTEQQQAVKRSPVSFLEASAEKRARLFLGTHSDKPVQQDELAELKAENPDAYVFVKALLTKRSLGLLNPKKPTASFAPKLSRTEQQLAAKEAAQQQAAKQGKVSPVQPVQPAKHHWMDWPARGDDQIQKMQNAVGKVAELSAKKTGLLSMESQSLPSQHDWVTGGRPDEDDQMVQNVLGPVFDPKGGMKTGLLSMETDDDDHNQMVRTMAKLKSCKKTGLLTIESAPPPAQHDWMNWRRQDDDDLLNGGKRTGLLSLEPPPPLPKAGAAVARTQQNSYLRANTSTPKKVEKSKAIPYFKVAAPPASAKKTSQVQASSTNYLASFSWDDSKPKPNVVARPKPKVHSLMAWLGDAPAAGTPAIVKSTNAKKAPAQQAAPVKPAKPVNTYLMDLN